MKKVILFFIVVMVTAFVFNLTGMDMPGTSVNKNTAMYMGYLSDIMSAETNNGIRRDGVNLKLHPEKHTVELMQSLPSALSGYGLFVKGSDGVYSFYRFDKKGTNLSKDLLKKTKKKSGISVNVTGELKDNIIYVDSIQEI
jgi:hypothetical protein